MARTSRKTKTVTTLTHGDASRKNIPTAEYQAVMAEDDRSPIEVAYERRNRDLDPQLVWRGKDAQDWPDLVVQAPPLFIQEKVHPKVLIDDLLRQSATGRGRIMCRPYSPTCSPTSTACRAPTPAPSFTSTTPTGRTA